MATDIATIADIIAEKRRQAEHIRNNLSTVPLRQWDQQAEIKLLEDEADRLEAARKRTEWTHKKELETRDAVIQTEVATREAEREAHKREIDELKKQVGNAAKLREALVSVKKSIDDMGAASLDGDPEVLLMSLTQVCARLSARIEAALAAPPRAPAAHQGERSYRTTEHTERGKHMSEAYEQELAEVRVTELMVTLGNLIGYAIDRGDSAAQERNCKLLDALQEYKDSKAKGEE